MEITVNDKLESVEDDLKLSEFLNNKSLYQSKGTAVAVNECVIAKNDWQKFVLQENDQILIIRATQGG